MFVMSRDCRTQCLYRDRNQKIIQDFKMLGQSLYADILQGVCKEIEWKKGIKPEHTVFCNSEKSRHQLCTSLLLFLKQENMINFKETLFLKECSDVSITMIVFASLPNVMSFCVLLVFLNASIRQKTGFWSRCL